MSADWVGKTIDGRYVVEQVVGAGGMGLVLRAKHRYTGATVALKVLRQHLRHDPKLTARFMAEARAPAAIGHPSIVAVTDAGVTASGDPYLVMEMLQGQSLGSLLRRGPVPIEHMVRIGTEVLDALKAAHGAGFVHRDLKPDNIFITQPNGAAKLLDFGLAKVLADFEGPGPTAAGTMLGTVAYMSPEQLRDSKNVDHRTDLWAMGVTVYQMASGLLPYHGTTTTELISAMLAGPPRPILQVLPDAPRELVDFLDRALARDLSHRFGSAAEMAIALRSLVAELPAAPLTALAAAHSVPPPAAFIAPPPMSVPPADAPFLSAPPPPPAKSGSAAPWLVGLGLGCLALLVIGAAVTGVVFYLGGRSAATAPASSPTAKIDCSGEACFRLGTRYEDGNGVAKDPVKAVALYRRACDDGFMLGCNALGNAYSYAFGGLPRDYAQARQLYERACDGSIMDSCHALGTMYETGLGVPIDRAKARAYFTKSCRGGRTASCDKAR